MSFSRRIGASPSIRNVVRVSELVMTLWPMMIRSNGFSTTLSDIAALPLRSPEEAACKSRLPGFLNVDDDLAIDPVGVIGAIAEADDIELDRRHQLQPRFGQDPRFQISGQRAGARDDGAELFGAVGFQGEPGLQRAEAARQVG